MPIILQDILDCTSTYMHLAGHFFSVQILGINGIYLTKFGQSLIDNGMGVEIWPLTFHFFLVCQKNIKCPPLQMGGTLSFLMCIA